MKLSTTDPVTGFELERWGLSPSIRVYHYISKVWYRSGEFHAKLPNPQWKLVGGKLI